MIRLTPRGFALFTLGVGLLVAAALTGLRSVAWPGGALVGLVAGSSLIAWLSTRHPRLRRRLLPERVAADSAARVALNVERDSVGFGSWSTVTDSVPPALGTKATLMLPSGWGALRGWHHYTLVPGLRGRYPIGPAEWLTTDPLGLATTRRLLGGTSLLTVTPAIHPLGVLPHGSGAGLSGESAQVRSTLLGADDALIRTYRPRDELRRIHWPSTARTGTLMVRREEHSWEPSAVILLDTRAGAHSGTGLGSTFEWAVSAAASIGVHLLDAGYEVELTDAQGRLLTTDGNSPREALLDHLTDIDVTSGEELEQSSQVQRRGQMLIAVLSRLSVADALALTALRTDARACRAIVLHPAEPGDSDPAEILLAAGWRVAPNALARGIAPTWSALTGAPR